MGAILRVSRAPRLATAIALLAVVVTSCSDEECAANICLTAPGETDVVPASVSLAPDSLGFEALLDTIRLRPTVRDDGGATLDVSVSAWTSSDVQVAAVDGTGLVMAIGQGSATVTATLGSLEAVAAVTVRQRAVSLEVSRDSLTVVGVGASAQVSLTARDANGNDVPDPTAVWASSDSTVVTAGPDGRVTAEGLGTATVSATVDGVTALVDVSVQEALRVQTMSLATGVTGAAYSATLQASGGDGTVTWSLVNGALPDGLSLSASTGVIDGAPTTTETSSFTVRATSGDGQSAERALQITVYDPLLITTTSLSAGVESAAYIETVGATGGDGNTSWSLVGGALPSGLDLDPSSGAVAGAPSQAGTFDFTARATSGDRQTADQALQIVVYAPLQVQTTSLATGVDGASYAETLEATGGDGDYSWSVVSGALPNGLGLTASTGLVDGTPTATGTFDFTMRVTSGDGQTVDEALQIIVYPPIEITTTSLANGVRGSFYSRTVSALGGDGSYTWSLRSGALPSGLSIGSSTGTISGTPSQAGTFGFTVQVVSGDGQATTRSLQIVVYQPLVITTTSLPTVCCSGTYSEQLQATGGAGGYTWSLASGSLPPGYTLTSGGLITGPRSDGNARYDFVVRVRSSDGQTDTQALSIRFVIG